MKKVSISARLNSDIVQWLDSKATKNKTRSDVLNETLTAAKICDQNQEHIRQQKDHADLLAKGARAAIMTLRILEVATKQHSDQAENIFQKAKIIYQKEMKIGQPETELET